MALVNWKKDFLSKIWSNLDVLQAFVTSGSSDKDGGSVVDGGEASVQLGKLPARRCECWILTRASYFQMYVDCICEQRTFHFIVISNSLWPEMLKNLQSVKKRHFLLFLFKPLKMLLFLTLLHQYIINTYCINIVIHSCDAIWSAFECD